jgi:hypothetical protein
MDVAEQSRFWSYVVKDGPEDCWLWTGALDRWGYGVGRANRRWALAHRVAFALANGEIPPGALVLHACDMPACVNAAHLRLGTNADNMRDMVAKGRGAGRKLDAEKVREIRTSRLSQGALARKLGVGRHAIRKVLSGRTWAHVS